MVNRKRPREDEVIEAARYLKVKSVLPGKGKALTHACLLPRTFSFQRRVLLALHDQVKCEPAKKIR